MKKWLFFLSVICCLQIQHLSGQIHIAVGDFENRSDWMYLDSWAKKIPDYLQHELSRNPEIILVERHKLQAILNEQALNMTGLVDSSNAQEIGRLISAHYIILGTVDRDDQWLRIDVKIINTTTGKVVTEKVQSKDRSRLNEMISLLGNNLQFQLSGQGNYQSQMKIRQYPTSVFLGITLTSGLITGLVNQAYQDKKQDYLNNTKINQFNVKYNAANRLYRTRNILAGVTGTAFLGTLYCWMYNLSPEEILASETDYFPYVWYDQGEVIIGMQITF